MTIRFVGDVALGRCTKWRLDSTGGAYVANIEGPVLDDAASETLHGHPYSTRQSLESFFGGRLVVANVANNHAADLCSAGLFRTIAHLESIGVAVVGDCARGRPSHTIVEHEGCRIGFLARVAKETFGTRERLAKALSLVQVLDESSLQEEIRKLRVDVDRLVVMLHWGEEWLSVPSPSRIAFARSLACNGADLVVGHHAHVPEAFEKYDGRMIAYGLGTVELRFPNQPSVARSYPRDGTKRSWWARKSLAVDWSPRENETRVRSLTWIGEQLALRGEVRPFHRSYLGQPSHERYRALSRRDYWFSKIRTAWETRTVPRLGHLKTLARIAEEAREAAKG